MCESRQKTVTAPKKFFRLRERVSAASGIERGFQYNERYRAGLSKRMY